MDNNECGIKLGKIADQSLRVSSLLLSWIYHRDIELDDDETTMAWLNNFEEAFNIIENNLCLLYTSPSPRD